MRYSPTIEIPDQRCLAESPILIVRTLIYPTVESAAVISSALPLWLSGVLCVGV